MSLVQVADVADELSNLSFTADTKPSLVQVQNFIDTIEAEVEGLLASCFAPWPTDPMSAPARFVRDTILEGAKNLTLRSKYSATPANMTPRELADSRDAYNDRLRRICDVAKSVRENTPESSGGFVPVVGAPEWSPGLSGSFAEYTTARNWVENTRYRPGTRPWPL